jgi:hypothetical protein
MHRTTSITLSIVLSFLPGVHAQAPHVFERRYESGQEFSYRIEDRRRQQFGETVTSTIAVARSAHRVAFEAGVPVEVVGWIDVMDLVTGINRTDLGGLPPSRVSLHPSGPIEPGNPVNDPLMIGMATDLVTFYISVSPKIGTANLHLPGDKATAPAPVFGNFADGTAFLVGRDKFRVDVEITALSAQTVEYATYLQPLAFEAGELHREFMQQAACPSAPNNIQYVRRQGESYLAAWGCESIAVQTKIDRQSGAIVEALMVNYLLQNVKTCQDAALTQCIDSPQIEENRTVDLRLLDHVQPPPTRSYIPPRQRP